MNTGTGTHICDTVGASDAAAAAGLHPHMSRAKLWRVLTGRELREVYMPDWLEAGKRNEGWAVQEAHRVAGFTWLETGQRQVSHHLGRFRATPDGRTMPYTLEVKCPQAGMYDTVPPYYLPQIAMQQYVCETRETLFLAWRMNEIRSWWVRITPEYTLKLLELLDDFLFYLDIDWEPPRVSRRPVMPGVIITEACHERVDPVSRYGATTCAA